MVGCPVDISADVAAQARSPLSFSPEPPPEVGATRVLTDRYVAFLTPMPTVTFVEALRFGPAEAGGVREEVRALLRPAGRTQAAWVVSSTQPELHEELLRLGLTPYTDPPLEEASTAMALTEAPAWPASPGVEVREAVSLEEFLAVGEMAARLFHMGDADAASLLDGQRIRYDLVQQGRANMRTYLATLDGEVVGEAQSTDCLHGTNLAGSSVVPEARGRGVYRALVSARWEHAVARGVPALTIQAGAMSGPILARLGFAVVDRQWVLCDRFA
ncbi:MAG: acetyltransferase [Frankiales bacterium]|nr:acetyltransferase [Frankiales bacterium]